MSLTLQMHVPLPVYLDEVVSSDSLAARLTTLEGKVIGFLPNWRPSAFDLLKSVSELLKERCGVAEVVLEQPIREIPLTNGRFLDGMDDQLDHLTRRVDAVITAAGD
ncbi:MAG: hypothetical protein HY525_00320 [Betaproteobacteria bacterium]|nr:hypothetical protein [Betaproteobacteria bacterium]